MLSFFAKKKIIQENNPDDPPIPGPVEQTNTTDDFIFVERKTTDGPTYPAGGAAYPIVPPNMYPGMPPSPAAYGPNRHYGQPIRQNYTEANYVPYVQGVPFVLAPQLVDASQGNVVTSTEVDRILAIITRQMSVDEEMNDYNFNLEKSVLNSIE